jgi:hypothetical protein
VAGRIRRPGRRQTRWVPRRGGHPLHPRQSIRGPWNGDGLLLIPRPAPPGRVLGSGPRSKMLDRARASRTLPATVTRRAAALAVLLVALVDARAAEYPPGPTSSRPPAVRIRDKPLVEPASPSGIAARRSVPARRPRRSAHALEMPGADRIRMEPQEGWIVLYAGTVPVLRISPADARRGDGRPGALRSGDGGPHRRRLPVRSGDA